MNHDLLLITTPRSGSDFFSQWLLKLYTFGWIGEWLAAGSLLQVRDQLGLPNPWKLTEFTAALRAQKASSDGRISIKIMWDTFAWTKWKGAREGCPEGIYSTLRNPAMVFLSRKDKLAQAISLYKARRTGIWHTDGSERIPDVEYDHGSILASLLEVVAGEQAWLEWLQTRDFHYQTVYYEEMIVDPRATLRSILSSCGMEQAEEIAQLPDPPNKRLARGNNRELYERFREDRPDLVSTMQPN